MPHDNYEFVEFLIEKEPYLLGLGLVGLTFGVQNLDDVLKKCLKHGSYKSMAIILDKYKTGKFNCVNFVELVFSAL